MRKVVVSEFLTLGGVMEDLINEFRLMVHPVVLGAGKRLFGETSEPKTLKLVDTKTFSSGTLVLTYQPAGEK